MERLLAITLLLTIIPAFDQTGYAQTNNGDKVAEATAVITRLFGDSVEVVKTGQSHFFLFGDFNGDTFTDLLTIAKLKTGRAGLPKDVTFLNPWGLDKYGPGTSNLALIIIHGASGGWDAPGRPRAYVLADSWYFSSPDWKSAPQDNLSVEKRATGQARRGAARLAKGDLILLHPETQGNMTLYWDGKTYRQYEPPSGPIT